MNSHSRRQFLAASTASASALWLGRSAVAGPFAPGVETIAASNISGDERTRQPDIWALEVHFKPVRMEYVDLPVPGQAGALKPTLVWYLCYRAINRPVASEMPKDAPVEQRPLFIPELTLVTEDGEKQRSYLDRVIPAAQAAILKRERHPYKNGVEIVGPIPEPTPAGSKTEKSVDGIALWRGVDPKTQFFKVFFSGFSNGYKVAEDPGADGKPVVLRKTLVQSFWRPGDEFDQNEAEIRLQDGPKWVYR
jgi:hypothetical protein